MMNVNFLYIRYDFLKKINSLHHNYFFSFAVPSNHPDLVVGASGSSTEQPSSENPKSSFNVMGNVLKFVESTGGMIVNSGLNTLESIGKKTMDVLQEGDPGLKKKRALFAREPDKPTLSQVTIIQCLYIFVPNLSI
jgi:hypothetical protein